MATIGFLGAGTVAQSLATGWERAGHTVLLARSRTSPAEGAWQIRGRTALIDIARKAEIIVNALPGSASLGVVSDLAPALSDKILIDVANAVDIDDSGFATSLRFTPESLAEKLQAALPETRVVKTLNTMHVSVMAAPGSLADKPLAFLSGNDRTAKKTVLELLADLGWGQANVVDLGDIRTARAPESFVLMIGPLVRFLGPVPFAFSVAR